MVLELDKLADLSIGVLEQVCLVPAGDVCPHEPCERRVQLSELTQRSIGCRRHAVAVRRVQVRPVHQPVTLRAALVTLARRHCDVVMLCHGRGRLNFDLVT